MRQKHEYSPEFEFVWKKWPGRWDRERSEFIKRKKHPAWLSWQKLDEDTRYDIITQIALIKKTEGSYPRDLVTWLNQKGWHDIVLPKQWAPQLPGELTDICKMPPAKTIDINTERNRQRKGLGL